MTLDTLTVFIISAETAPASDTPAEDGASKDAGSDAGKDADSASAPKDQAGTATDKADAAETAKEAADKPKSKSKKAAKKSKGGSLMQFIPGMSGGKKAEKQAPEPEVPFVPWIYPSVAVWCKAHSRTTWFPSRPEEKVPPTRQVLKDP